MLYTQVKIDWSHGRGKYGATYAYIRPTFKCNNRSRRIRLIQGEDKVKIAVEKYYTPCNYYLIENKIIGAADEKLALKEYWKICEDSKIKQVFAVHPIIEIMEGTLEKQLELLYNHTLNKWK